MSRANRFGFRAPVVAATPAPDSLYTLIDEVRKNTAAQLSGSPQNRTASSSTKVKEFSVYDRILLDGWFGLTEQDKINGLEPTFWNAVEACGKNKHAVRQQMQAGLVADMTSNTPTDVFVTPAMVDDALDLNFGYGGSLLHATCHRGASIYACSQKSEAEQSSINQAEDDRASATAVTPADNRASRLKPPMLRYEYVPVLTLLSGYLMFLLLLFGASCEHYMEVKGISDILRRQYAIAHAYTAVDYCQIIWQIFADGRQFFAKTGGDPSSGLQFLRLSLMSKVVPCDRTCPTHLLMCAEAIAPTLKKSVTFKQEGEGGDQGGGQGGPTKKIYETQPGQWTRSKHPKSLAKKAARAFKKDPKLSIEKVLAETGTQMANVRIGAKGECQQFQILGHCPGPCSYRHTPSVQPLSDRVEAASKMLTKFNEGS